MVSFDLHHTLWITSRFFNASIFNPKRQKQIIAHTQSFQKSLFSINHFPEYARMPKPKETAVYYNLSALELNDISQ
jgi:hypothetical protein